MSEAKHTCIMKKTESTCQKAKQRQYQTTKHTSHADTKTNVCHTRHTDVEQSTPNTFATLVQHPCVSDTKNIIK